MRFDELDWWLDPTARSGPDVMAVDEWLLQTAERPRLRVYAWDGLWASLGYFGNLEAGMKRLPGRNWVRRRTGGGVVDHAGDWTYTLAVPKQFSLARTRGGDSYLVIHRALVEALAAEEIMAELAEDLGDASQPMCFQNPVPHDIVAGGEKIAGAGQRRSRYGLLHQGSVAGRCEERQSIRRAAALAASLSDKVNRVDLHPPADVISEFAKNYEAGPAQR